LWSFLLPLLIPILYEHLSFGQIAGTIRPLNDKPQQIKVLIADAASIPASYPFLQLAIGEFYGLWWQVMRRIIRPC
jgi:hypothetical protein